MSDIKSPRVFISYAWEEDTKVWVQKFGSLLRSHGVDTILDQWHVVPGDLLPDFMEESIRESDFVLIICTPTYKIKSESKNPSGVVYEKGVITGELFTKRNQRKFIPVLQKGEWQDAAPSWILGKTYVDLRDSIHSKNNYRSLLKTLYGKKEPPPFLGSPPDFIKPKEYRKATFSRDFFSSRKASSSQLKVKRKNLTIILFIIIILVLTTIFGISSLLSPSIGTPEPTFTQLKEMVPKPTELTAVSPSLTFTATSHPSATFTQTPTVTKTSSPTFTSSPIDTSTLAPTSTRVFTPTSAYIPDALQNNVEVLYIRPNSGETISAATEFQIGVHYDLKSHDSARLMVQFIGQKNSSCQLSESDSNGFSPFEAIKLVSGSGDAEFVIPAINIVNYNKDDGFQYVGINSIHFIVEEDGYSMWMGGTEYLGNDDFSIACYSLR